MVVFNPGLGKIEFTKVFDTYKSSDSFEEFIESIERNDIPDDLVVAVACQDECITNLTSDCREWLESMGSNEIYKLEYR